MEDQELTILGKLAPPVQDIRATDPVIPPADIFGKDTPEYVAPQSDTDMIMEFVRNRDQSYLSQTVNMTDDEQVVLKRKAAMNRLGNAVTDFGTNIAVMGTQFRRPTAEEIEQGRGDWNNKAALLEKAATYGVANELAGGLISKIPQVVAASKTVGKNIGKDLLNTKGDYKRLTTDLKPKAEYPITELNPEQMAMADEYARNLTQPKTIDRLMSLDREYGTRFTRRVFDWTDNYSYAKDIGYGGEVANSKIKVQENSLDALGVNKKKPRADRDIIRDFYESAQYKGVKPHKPMIKTTDDSRMSFLHPNMHPADYETTIWHELAHDVNHGGAFIEESPKLARDLNAIFQPDHLSVDLKAAKKAREAMTYSSYKEGYIKSAASERTIEEITESEYKYITNPTETWSFLSTNLRQNLVKEGYLKNYTDLLTEEIVEKALSKGGTVLSRWEPYIADKKQLVKMFNKLTLSTLSIGGIMKEAAENNTEE